MATPIHRLPPFCTGLNSSVTRTNPWISSLTKSTTTQASARRSSRATSTATNSPTSSSATKKASSYSFTPGKRSATKNGKKPSQSWWLTDAGKGKIRQDRAGTTSIHLTVAIEAFAHHHAAGAFGDSAAGRDLRDGSRLQVLLADVLQKFFAAIVQSFKTPWLHAAEDISCKQRKRNG